MYKFFLKKKKNTQTKTKKKTFVLNLDGMICTILPTTFDMSIFFLLQIYLV